MDEIKRQAIYLSMHFVVENNDRILTKRNNLLFRLSLARSRSVRLSFVICRVEWNGMNGDRWGYGGGGWLWAIPPFATIIVLHMQQPFNIQIHRQSSLKRNSLLQSEPFNRIHLHLPVTALTQLDILIQFFVAIFPLLFIITSSYTNLFHFFPSISLPLSLSLTWYSFIFCLFHIVFCFTLAPGKH